MSVNGVEVVGEGPGQSGHRLAILEERNDESGRREPGDVDGRARNSRRCQVLIDQVHARGEAPFRRVRIERRRDRLESGAGSAEDIAHHGGEMVVIGVGGGQIRERSGDGGDGHVVDQGDLGGVERRAVVTDVGLPRLLALRSGEGVPDGDEVPHAVQGGRRGVRNDGGVDGAGPLIGEAPGVGAQPCCAKILIGIAVG